EPFGRIGLDVMMDPLAPRSARTTHTALGVTAIVAPGRLGITSAACATIELARLRIDALTQAVDHPSGAVELAPARAIAAIPFGTGNTLILARAVSLCSAKFRTRQRIDAIPAAQHFG